jgi:hypothetical protein
MRRAVVLLVLALACAALLGTNGSLGAVTVAPTANAFVQQGAKLKPAGGAGDARFGWRVALSGDGRTALIGGPYYKARAGGAWVFTRSGAAWTQQGGVLTGSGGSFGFSVAVSANGDTALVGAPAADGGAGAAWVFTRSGSIWKRQAKLTGGGESGAAQFGWSVALSGNGQIAVVGGPHDAGGLGAVWTFTGSGSAWTPRGPKLTGKGESGSGGYGSSLALARGGSTVLVGAPRDHGGLGAAWAYQRSVIVALPNVFWGLRGGKLTGGGGRGPGAFGESVALSDDGARALVGGPFDNDNVGAAWAFHATGSGWTQEGAKLTDRGGVVRIAVARAEEFGMSVSLSGNGNTALVGAPTDGGRTGTAWLFTRSRLGGFGGAVRMTGGGESGAGEFGLGVALADDGSVGVIGGPLDAASTLGAAWVFANTRVVDLGGATNLRIDGAAAGDFAGESVASAGDVNGDGRPDVIVGAPGADENGRASSGSAYVVFGRASPGTVDLAALGNGGFRIDGAATLDRAGDAVAGAGDVNRDGLADLIVGAPDASNNGRADAGSVYVVYGKASTTPVDLADLGAGGYRIDGANGGLAHGDEAGLSVASVGEVNADGRPDLVLGAHHAGNNGRAESGSAYVVFGKSSPTTIDLAALGNRGFRIDGALAGEQAGWSVGGGGDVNGDGRRDVILGAVTASRNGRPMSGSAYVVFGKGSTASVDLADLGTGGYRIDGASAGDLTGASVAGAGDVDGDGRADVILGALSADADLRTDSGSAYVVFGKASSATVDLAGLGAGGFRIDGAAAGDAAGGSVAGAGDVNGDGRSDVIVGSLFADKNGRIGSGSAYVVSGTAATSPVDLSALGDGGFRIDGAAAGDGAGRVSGAGDVDGDGRPDVLVGAPNADGNGRPDSGSAYVVFG